MNCLRHKIYGNLPFIQQQMPKIHVSSIYYLAWKPVLEVDMKGRNSSGFKNCELSQLGLINAKNGENYAQ